MIKINYPGTGNNGQFTFDALGRNVKVAEVSGGLQSSTKEFVWSDNVRRDERDGNGAVLNRFFWMGQDIGGIANFYLFDHLGSVREVTDSSGTLIAENLYDPFGRSTRTNATLPSNFGFAGYYQHEPSKMYLAFRRFYVPGLARWASRDPIEEAAGSNLYAYVGSDPIGAIDPRGEDICLKSGSTNQNIFSFVNPAHEAVCVDTWSCDCKIKTGTICFTYTVAPFFVPIPGLNIVVPIYPIIGPLGLGTVVGEPDATTNTVSCKRTTCQQDKQFLKKMIGKVTGVRGPYSALPAGPNCVTWSEWQYIMAPGRVAN